MSYKIKPLQIKKAKALNLTIKPSTNKKKKVDVFNKEGKKLASVGAIGYGDFGTFKRTKGKEFADKRRIAYKKRHQKTRVIVGSRSYYADKLLW